MTDELEKQVIQNASDIRILTKTTDDILTGVNNIDKLLRGKDSENPGLVLKIDRLENSSNRLDKKIKNVIGASVTTMIAMAATVLSWALGLFSKGS